MFNMDIEMISKRIQELCKKRGWSYYRLAKEVDFQQSSITSIIKGKNMPTIYTLDKICSALNITLSEFFQDDQTDNVNQNFFCLWEQLPASDKEKVLIYIHGLLHKPIGGDNLNDI